MMPYQLSMIKYSHGETMSKLTKVLSGHVYNLVTQALNGSTGNYFEIGVFNGVGFAGIATAFLDRYCYAVDPFIEDGNTVDNSKVGAGNSMPAQQASAFSHIEGLLNAEIAVMTSHAYKEALTTEQIDSMNVSVVLIDGNHHYEFVVNDYELSMKLIGNKEGYVIFDDTDVPDVNRALLEFTDLYEQRIIGSDTYATGILIKLKAV
jgi:Methyltransferase domain